MPSPASPVSIGIDFGTTNTVVAIAGADGRAEAITFLHDGASLKGYVTALCYWQERAGGRLTTRVEGGPWAMDQLMTGTMAHRFIQSFKTFAASRSFQETRIFGQKTQFEDLLVAFMQTVQRHADREIDFGCASIAGSQSAATTVAAPAAIAVWVDTPARGRATTATEPSRN